MLTNSSGDGSYKSGQEIKNTRYQIYRPKDSPRPHPPTNPQGPVWAPPWTAPSSVGSGALQSLKQNYFLTIKILIKSKLSVSSFFHWISEFQYFNWNLRSFQQNLEKKNYMYFMCYWYFWHISYVLINNMIIFYFSQIVGFVIYICWQLFGFTSHF